MHLSGSGLLSSLGHGLLQQHSLDSGSSITNSPCPLPCRTAQPRAAGEPEISNCNQMLIKVITKN